jgi:hypothetical protein
LIVISFDEIWRFSIFQEEYKKQAAKTILSLKEILLVKLATFQRLAIGRMHGMKV